jgi:hypothetical protein
MIARTQGMRVVASIVWLGQIWITAAMTLIAGVPFADCICPDGTHKPFCSGRSAKETSCCGSPGTAQPPTAKSCCAAKKPGCCVPNAGQTAPPKAPEECSNPRRQRPSQDHGRDGQFEAKGCSRVLAPSRSPIVTPAQPMGRDSFAATASVLFPTLGESFSAPTAPACSLAWQPYRQPPPTDFVITLQRLVI